MCSFVDTNEIDSIPTSVWNAAGVVITGRERTNERMNERCII